MRVDFAVRPCMKSKKQKATKTSAILLLWLAASLLCVASAARAFASQADLSLIIIVLSLVAMREP